MTDKFTKYREEALASDVPLLIVSNLHVLGDTVEEVQENIILARKANKKIVLAEHNIMLWCSDVIVEEEIDD